MVLLYQNILFMPALFNTPESARLGLHALVSLARTPGERQTVNELTRTLGVSAAHLAKVLSRLKAAGLVVGHTGPGGGYALAQSAEKISLLEVYEAVTGKLETHRCPFALPLCDRGCPLGDFLIKTNWRVYRYLKKTTLNQMKINLGGKRCNKKER